MIVELTVDNLAIINHAQLQFGNGLTVFTGETGAGKSLMIDALELALGERADSELVRSGSAKAVVHLVVDLTGEEGVLQSCRELGIELEDNLLYIHREVFAEGRSTCRINGAMTPVGSLKKIGTLLVDLHGQHRHQSLLDPETHSNYLDQWIGKEANGLLEQIGAAYLRFRTAEAKVTALAKGIREREQKLDLLRYQINEIESVNPVQGEVAELDTSLARLKNFERLNQGVQATLLSISESENSAGDQLRTAFRQLSDAVKLDASLEPLFTQLQEALVIVDEVTHGLSGYAAELEADPNLLDSLIERQDAIKRLRRKYGDDESQILEFLANAKQELDQLEDAEHSQEQLLAEQEASRKSLDVVCSQLTNLRKEHAGIFSKAVQYHLADLGMNKAELDVLIAATEPSANGADTIEFLFNANPGEVLKPLAKIASGGEISRVMLAMKCALAGKAGVPTLIFDEVDTGLGGKAAATMGRKLAELAEHYQVIVISHLPQVASRASNHFKILKQVSEARVVTEVIHLDDAQRVDEIARMLAGETVTETAIANAREMLQLH